MSHTTYARALADAVVLGSLASAGARTPKASAGLPTRQDCLDALARHSYEGPTSWTASDLRPRAALMIALTHAYRRPVVIARNTAGGMTRNECLAALDAMGWVGPVSFTATRCRWLVAAVYAERLARAEANAA